MRWILSLGTAALLGALGACTGPGNADAAHTVVDAGEAATLYITGMT